jgi:signal peptidase II
VLSFAVAAWLWTWAARTPRPLTAAALGLLIGGALGNALDRLIHGAVVDFALFYWGKWEWYVFNLADAGIVAGVALLLYESLKEGRRPR